MKASKFSEAQIEFVLKQAEDGMAVDEVRRRAGISEARFYNWRKRYAGLKALRRARRHQFVEQVARDMEGIGAQGMPACRLLPLTPTNPGTAIRPMPSAEGQRPYGQSG